MLELLKSVLSSTSEHLGMINRNHYKQYEMSVEIIGYVTGQAVHVFRIC